MLAPEPNILNSTLRGPSEVAIQPCQARGRSEADARNAVGWDAGPHTLTLMHTFTHQRSVCVSVVP